MCTRDGHSTCVSWPQVECDSPVRSPCRSWAGSCCRARLPAPKGGLKQWIFSLLSPSAFNPFRLASRRRKSKRQNRPTQNRSKAESEKVQETEGKPNWNLPPCHWFIPNLRWQQQASLRCGELWVPGGQTPEVTAKGAAGPGQLSLPQPGQACCQKQLCFYLFTQHRFCLAPLPFTAEQLPVFTDWSPKPCSATSCANARGIFSSPALPRLCLPLNLTLFFIQCQHLSSDFVSFRLWTFFLGHLQALAK